jgi:hypothetical protein
MGDNPGVDLPPTFLENVPWAASLDAALRAASLQDVFWGVLLVVVIGAALVAVVTMLGTGKLYDQIGRGLFSINEEVGRGGAGAGPPQEPAGVREAEIRQLVAARNEHRVRRGMAPLDVDDEVRRLTGHTGVDPALREEIRQLVVARNERRARAGKPPLDVEAEIERQIRELG